MTAMSAKTNVASPHARTKLSALLASRFSLADFK